jgi:hypothetical protein
MSEGTKGGKPGVERLAGRKIIGWRISGNDGDLAPDTGAEINGLGSMILSTIMADKYHKSGHGQLKRRSSFLSIKAIGRAESI